MEMQLFTEVGMPGADRVVEDQEQRFPVGGWIGVCGVSIVRSGNQSPVGVVQSTKVLKIKRPSPDPPPRVLWQWGMGSALVLPASTSRRIFPARSSLL